MYYVNNTPCDVFVSNISGNPTIYLFNKGSNSFEIMVMNILNPILNLVRMTV